MQENKFIDLYKKGTSDFVFREQIQKEVLEILKSSAFTKRKITDTANDSLEVVNRRTVTLNGSTANRPASPVNFLPYFDVDLGYPIWFNGSDWVDAQGNTA